MLFLSKGTALFIQLKVLQQHINVAFIVVIIQT